MDPLSSKLLDLYEESPVLMAAYDGTDRLRAANAAFRAAFFLERGETPTWAELMRRNFPLGRGTVIRATDFEGWLLSTVSRRGKTRFRAFETDLHDGRWLWMTETVDEEGWMLCIASDITSMRAGQRQVRQDRDLAIRASHTDELTGLANRRFVIARIEEMLARPGPDGGLGSLAVLDLDHFKHINDRYGHHVGDRILRDLAVRIHRLVGRVETFGRVGGEEFLLVLPGVGLEAAGVRVEHMLDAIRATRPIAEHPELAYTFSAGVAPGLDGDTAESLYARADEALYTAKIAGRNCVHLAGLGPLRSLTEA
ncbi:GGDEF domain-containing protein [Azorhizobium oxalatiphilum]|uniref:diguanylate cyclase n=1 Tax=Azorhizobium oxalatiphilum TaxID=980631 RepID=A0A917BQ25_9HYPH|nr:GGDEF domain-containing protein [Azorhizobium oxalatiphilum]GGF52927.1 GGDEF domain-containing protein [Azorhizobium oxalatiphilum]